MKPLYTCFLLLCSCLVVANVSSARDSNREIIKKNLTVTKYAVDTEASAVVLFERTDVTISWENSMFVEKENVHKIIKILKSDATALANVSVLYPKNDWLNYVNKVKGITYNISGSDTVSVPIDSKDLYRKKIAGDFYELSFSLLSVKEGSVIEYSYEIVKQYQDFILSWEVQEKYPKLMSEYNVEYTGSLTFTAISHVREAQKEYSWVEDAENSSDNFCMVKKNSGYYSRFFWVRKNVGGVNREPYINNFLGHLERVELQLTSVKIPRHPLNISNSWEKVNSMYWVNFKWGENLGRKKKYMDDVVDSVLNSTSSQVGRAKAIFSYVRSRYKSNNSHNDITTLNLKSIYKSEEASKLEINFLLTGMLLEAGFDASPVLLGTTDRLPLSKVFPVLDRIDYMVCAVKIDSDYIFLDASDKNSSFGILPLQCYNGFVWLLGDTGRGLTLHPGLLKEKTALSVKVCDFTDSTAKMDIVVKYGMVMSQAYRKEWEKDDEEEKKFINAQEQNLPPGVKVFSSSIENKSNPDTSIIVKYSCQLSFDKNIQSLYFPSTLMRYFSENPFKSTVRKLPIEFPFKAQYVYAMNIILPENMEPDSIPQPMILDYETESITFKKNYAFYAGMNTVSMNTNFSINVINFDNDYYDSLRQFFQSVIEEENAVITIKRKRK